LYYGLSAKIFISTKKTGVMAEKVIAVIGGAIVLIIIGFTIYIQLVYN